MTDAKEIRVETGSNTPWGIILIGGVCACIFLGIGIMSLSGSFGFHPLDPEANAKAVLISTQGAKATEQYLEHQAELNKLALVATEAEINRRINAANEFESVREWGRGFGKFLIVLSGSALSTGAVIGLVAWGDYAQKKRKQFAFTRIGVALLQATNPKGDNMIIDEVTGESWKAGEPHKPSQKRIDAITDLMKSGRQVQIFAGEKAHAPGDGLEIIQASPIPNHSATSIPKTWEDRIIEGEIINERPVR